MAYYNYTLCVSAGQSLRAFVVRVARRLENRPRSWNPDSWHVKAGNEAEGMGEKKRRSSGREGTSCSAVRGRNATHKRTRQTTNDTPLSLSLFLSSSLFFEPHRAFKSRIFVLITPSARKQLTLTAETLSWASASSTIRVEILRIFSGCDELESKFNNIP